jgi:phosphoglycerate dehydrogenase-like enzyme
VKPILVSRTRFPGAAFERAEALFDVRTTDGPLRAACVRGEHADAAAIWSFGERVDDELLDALPALRAVGNQGVGFDTIDRDALDRRGIVLCIPRGQNADAVADHALALLLAVRHQVVAGDRFIREGRWGGRGGAEPQGVDITGSVLGIVGLGHIGRAVARRADAFGMRILGWNRTPRPETGIEQVALDDLLAQADHVSVHCALADGTRGLLGERELGLLRPTAVLINTARGAIVDTDALIAALEADRLWGAGLDVFPHEPEVDPRLLEHPRVVLTPHIADNQPGVYGALTAAVVADLEAVFAPR